MQTHSLRIPNTLSPDYTEMMTHYYHTFFAQDYMRIMKARDAVVYKKIENFFASKPLLSLSMDFLAEYLLECTWNDMLTLLAKEMNNKTDAKKFFRFYAALICYTLTHQKSDLEYPENEFQFMQEFRAYMRSENFPIPDYGLAELEIKFGTKKTVLFTESAGIPFTPKFNPGEVPAV